MKRLAFLAVLVLLVQFVPVQDYRLAISAPGKWSQASGAITPYFDEFLRTDNTGNTVCASTPDGTPFVVWQEYRGPEYKICVSTFDGANWVPPSGDTSFNPQFEILSTIGNNSDPSITVFTYDDGSGVQYIPIIFYKKTYGYHDICYAYLKNGVWNYGSFYSSYNIDVPFVTVADDGTIMATWSRDNGSGVYLPVFIKASPTLPLVWKYADNSVVSAMPNTIFSGWDNYLQCHVASFNGYPYLIASRRVTGNDSDIAILKWDGANWGGIDGMPVTTVGDPALDDVDPRIAMNASGSPVICWQIDDAFKTAMFAFWNGLTWVNPEGNGILNLSTRFCAGQQSFSPDLVKGTDNTFHLAFGYRDGTTNSMIYTYTDLVDWYMASGDVGINYLGFGVANPSLAVSAINNPMIAGDRVIPSDNPAYTQWTTDGDIVVDWGIETNPDTQFEFLNRYDDNGKTIPSKLQAYKLRVTVGVPKKMGKVDVTVDYTVPPRCVLTFNIGATDFPDYFMILGQTNWYELTKPVDPSFDWTKIQCIRYERNGTQLAAIRFGIIYNGIGQTGKWLVNNTHVTVLPHENTNPNLQQMRLASVLPVAGNYLYDAVHSVSNPVQNPAPPSFYIDADTYTGQISTDGAKEAVFNLLIYPLGPFYEEVDLTLSTPPNSNLVYTFEPQKVPRGMGVRRSVLRIRGTERTPAGTHSLLVTGKALQNGYYTPTVFSANAEPQYITATLNLSVYTVAPKLALTKRADRVSVSPGSYINYTIIIQNVGGASATSVSLEDQLPQDVDYISSFPNGAGSGKKVVWDIGTINPGQTLIYTLKVQVKQIQFSAGAAISNVAVAYYNGWLTSAATVFVMVRPTDVPCPQPQAELKFSTEGDEPQAGKPIEGKLYVWDGCNPYSFQLFWGDDSPRFVGNLDKEGFYSLPPHTYETAGTYLISCHVTDKYGKQNVIRKHIVVH